MRRLTAEEVLTAYAATGVIPKFSTWYRANENCACAMGAVFLAKEGVENGKRLTHRDSGISKYYEEIRDEIVNSIGLHPQYITGFIDGFDSGSFGNSRANYIEDVEQRNIYQAGIEDGIDIRDRVLLAYPDTKQAEEEDFETYE